MAEYLEELSAISGQPLDVRQLEDTERAASVREASRGFIDLPKQEFEIPFSDLARSRFLSFRDRLAELNASRIYIWTAQTTPCGLYSLSTLKEVPFNFRFSINAQGIIVFLTSDMRDRLLLDLFHDESSHEMVKVELQGADWFGARY